MPKSEFLHWGHQVKCAYGEPISARLDCPLGKLDILEYMYRETVLV